MGQKSKRAAFVLSAAVAVAAAIGCDGGRKQAQTTPPDGTSAVGPPTTLPSAAANAPAPLPATQPVASFLWLREVPDPRKSLGDQPPPPTEVDDTWTAVQFPRARLRLSTKGEDRLVALFYSDDPKEAIGKDWQGDRYYFRMPMPHAADPAEAGDGAAFRPFRMSAPLGDTEETTNGVFLKGDRYHLEPVDLSVRFEPQAGGIVNVYVGGRFKQTDVNDLDAEPRWFHLQGIVQAAVD